MKEKTNLQDHHTIFLNKWVALPPEGKRTEKMEDLLSATAPVMIQR